MMEIDDFGFSYDKLSDYEKFVISGFLDESVVCDTTEDTFFRRFYQYELTDQVKKLNRILFVPLERDKFHIAVSYVRYAIRTSANIRIFYVVESSNVANAVAFFTIHLPLRIIGIEDYRTIESWFLESNQMFVVSTEVFVQIFDMIHFEIHQSDVCMFDMCGVPSNPYIFKQPITFRVIILASTFNLTIENVDDFFEYLKKIEVTFNSSLLTSQSCHTVKKYLANTFVKSVKFTPSKRNYDRMENIMQIMKIISDMRCTCSNVCDDFGEISLHIRNMLEYLEKVIETYGLYPAYIIASIYQIRLEIFKLDGGRIHHVILSSFLTDFNVIRTVISEEISKSGSLHGAKSILSNCDEKIVKLISLLCRMDFQDNCIVFVQNSAAALMVTYIFQKLISTSLIPNISVDCVISFSEEFLTDTIRERLLHKKYERRTLKKFHKGIINVLIMPWDSHLQSILTADWIIYFDPPPNYQLYLKSRKYGNFTNNQYFFFVEKSKSEENNSAGMIQLEKFLELDTSLKEVLKRKDIDSEYLLSRCHRMGIENLMDLVKQFPPLFTKTKKEVSLSNAIAVLNGFCSALPCDAFSRSAPKFRVRRTTEGFVGKLRLPIQSSVKNRIKCPPIKNIAYVKNVVALETVKMLYNLGKINDDLIPTIKNVNNELFDADLFPFWRHEGDATRGSASSYSIISLNFPEWLNYSAPKSGISCYLHIIHLKPTYHVPPSSRKLFFHNLMASAYEFGILTSKKLPKICAFPIFTDLGQVDVFIEVNAANHIPTVEEVAKLVSFHQFIFLDILDVIKNFLVCDNSNGENSYYVVPLAPSTAENETLSIAWDVVNNLSQKKDIHQPTEQERIHFNYFGFPYIGKVVTPWYQTPPQRHYIVTNVLSGCSPSSCFSSTEYGSYSEYYRDKYGLEVKQTLQPLLEARSVNTSLNCLRPRAQKAGTQRKRGEKIKDFQETLIPEFCVVQPFPAVYWYKSMTLIAVLHRLHFILNAETIRNQFALTALPNSILQNENDASDILRADLSCISDIEENNKLVLPIASVLKDVKFTKKFRSYPWADDCLPSEIDKNIDITSVLDVMAYYDFVKISMKSISCVTNLPFEQISIKERSQNSNLKFLATDRALSAGPKQSDIIQATTPRQCNDIVNLERFKLIGNAFLRFAISFMAFKLYPHFNLHQLNDLKRKLIGKRNLFYCATQMQLGSFLKLQDISASNDWNLSGFSVPNALINILKNSEVPPEVIFSVEIPRDEQLTGIISLKTRNNINENMIAYCNERIKSGNAFSTDAASMLTENNNHALVYLGKLCVPDEAVVEVLKSLVGVYLTNCGIRSTFTLLQKIGLMKQKMKISDLYLPNEESTFSEYYFPGFDVVCEKINYKFKSTKFIYIAFIHHTSFPKFQVECNQRLAFLGGAILDVLITNYIYETCPSFSFDRIEDLRISLVNDILYAVLVVRLGLHKFLLHESPCLMEKIDEFARKQEKVHHGINSRDYLFMIEETNSHEAVSIDVPKALVDIFKAIVAAVFVDCCGDLEVVWNVCEKIMKNEFEKFLIDIPQNPVKLLMDTDLPIEFKSPTIYEKDHNLVKVILNIEIDRQKRCFSGIGFCKLQAKIIAAKLALKHFYKEFTL